MGPLATSTTRTTGRSMVGCSRGLGTRGQLFKRCDSPGSAHTAQRGPCACKAVLSAEQGLTFPTLITSFTQSDLLFLCVKSVSEKKTLESSLQALVGRPPRGLHGAAPDRQLVAKGRHPDGRARATLPSSCSGSCSRNNSRIAPPSSDTR